MGMVINQLGQVVPEQWIVKLIKMQQNSYDSFGIHNFYQIYYQKSFCLVLNSGWIAMKSITFFARIYDCHSYWGVLFGSSTHLGFYLAILGQNGGVTFLVKNNASIFKCLRLLSLLMLGVFFSLNKIRKILEHE